MWVTSILLCLACGVLTGELQGEGRLGNAWKDGKVVEEVASLVEGKLRECHVVLVHAGTSTHLAERIIRRVWGSGGTREDVALVVVDAEALRGHQRKTMEDNLWGDPRLACRAVLLATRVPDEAPSLLSFLEESGLWRWSAAWVVVVGEASVVDVTLMHHALRNTVRALYFPLPGTARHRDAFTAAVGERVKKEAQQKEVQREEEEEEIEVYQRCLYCANGDMGVMETTPHQLVTELPRVFNGHKFRVVTIKYFPTIDHEPEGAGGLDTRVRLRDSLNTRMLVDIARHLNFTYETHEPLDRQWGSDLGGGNWTGLVGTLQRQEADFSTTITPTAARLLIMRHSKIYASDPFVIVSLKTQTKAEHMAIAKPFPGEVWVMVGVSVAASGIAAVLLKAAVKEQWRARETRGTSSKQSTLLYLWGVLLETPPNLPPMSVTIKVLVAWWLLSCLVLSAAYRSSLAAHFTVGVKAPPVDSFVDLVARDSWRWGSEPLGGASLFYFTSSIDATTRAVFAKMEAHSLDDNMRLVLGGRYAFITTQFQSAYQVASRYTDPRGYTPIHTGARHYPKFAGTSWGFRIGAPCLPAITVMTQRLIEGGLISYWLVDVIATRVREERRVGSTYSQALAEHWTSPSESEGDEEVVVRMAHLYAAFYILAAGLALSCLAFSGEILLARYCCGAYRLCSHIRA
ncbi:probable glutamate receptor isoform X2 [Portunus trituberculatus]|uniref:probable glutamate receptor isoform X2 n=1 Tax=Portunus trituberculatus TaxID=210409 RepID=UPI001E1CC14A|nr:probable glutamate receptor isoform X2 [Portunus trituberculatus]